jgi:hypothetical protein
VPFTVRLNGPGLIALIALAIPVVLAEQMAYLLRVVYPTSKRLEKRLDAECELLRDEISTPPASTPAPPRAGDADGFFDPDNPDA